MLSYCLRLSIVHSINSFKVINYNKFIIFIIKKNCDPCLMSYTIKKSNIFFLSHFFSYIYCSSKLVSFRVFFDISYGLSSSEVSWLNLLLLRKFIILVIFFGRQNCYRHFLYIVLFLFYITFLRICLYTKIIRNNLMYYATKELVTTY